MNIFIEFDQYYTDSDTFPVLVLGLFNTDLEDGVCLGILGLSLSIGIRR